MAARALTEPTWGTPQDAHKALSSLCHTGGTPEQLTGGISQMIRCHWNNPDSIRDPLLRDLASSDNSCDDGGGIYIAHGSTESIASTDRVPAIYVSREGYSANNNWHNEDKIGGGTTAGVSPKNSKKRHMIFTGSHTIVCKGLSRTETSRIAEETAFFLLHYCEVIRKDLLLGSFALSNVGKITPSNTGTDSYTCSITVKWSKIYAWEVIKHSPLIQRLASSAQFTTTK